MGQGKNRSTALLLLIVVFLGLVTACSRPSSAPMHQNEDPMTGDFETPRFGSGIGSAGSKPLETGMSLYVDSDRLRARSSPSIQDNNVEQVLALGDRVILRKLPDPGSEFVGVEIPALQNFKLYYVGLAYLSTKPPQNFSEYFVIQNLATEKTRVYRRCADDKCAHELVLETENVVGENTREMRTWLGSYKITRWFKFYEDSDRRYPSWYHPNYPAIPTASDPLSFWFDRKYIPNRNGEIRGAFGWYAAYIGPDASAQWLHGTFGWGSQKKAPLAKTRSHGCTRFDNESVAYLRHLLRLGTPVIRIYALEKRAGQATSRPELLWPYILTNEAVQAESGNDSDRDLVLARGVPKSRWLEVGQYSVNRTANVAVVQNPYQLSNQEFRGFLNVDTGRLEAYVHPRNLDLGGYRDQLIPRYLISNLDSKNQGDRK